MTCPSEIARILLAIIRTGTLNIRAAGWSGDAKRCAAEADHIHNLPDLVANYYGDGLRYYWEIEKPSFEKSHGGTVASFQSLWDELRPFAEQSRVSQAS